MPEFHCDKCKGTYWNMFELDMCKGCKIKFEVKNDY